MPKNTFILVILLAVFAAIVIGVNLGKKVTNPTSQTIPPQTSSPTPSTTPVKLYTYANRSCGISVTYPEYFTILENPVEGAILTNTQNAKDAVIITCQKEIPRIPLTDDKIENFTIGTVSAQLFHDASQNDSTPIDKLIFTHPGTKKDVYIAGYGADFNTMVTSLQLVSP